MPGALGQTASPVPGPATWQPTFLTFQPPGSHIHMGQGV